MTIQQMLQYSNKTKELLQTLLSENSEAFTEPFETLSAYNTVQKLLAHIIGAEERWVLYRLQGKIVEIRFEDRAPAGVEDIFDAWDKIRKQTMDYIAGLNDTDLDRVLAFNLPSRDTECKMSVSQILYHLFNHQTYHLGQISMALQRMNIDPPNFDYPLFVD